MFLVYVEFCAYYVTYVTYPQSLSWAHNSVKNFLIILPPESLRRRTCHHHWPRFSLHFARNNGSRSLFPLKSIPSKQQRFQSGAVPMKFPAMAFDSSRCRVLRWAKRSGSRDTIAKLNIV